MRGDSLTRCVAIAVVVTAVLSAGCGRLPGGRGWGQDVTAAPGWDRVARAARDAALSPEVWAPVGAALALQVGDADREISDWAAERTPVFGSKDRARDASTFLVGAVVAGYVVTGAATPVGEEDGSWFVNKCRGAAVGAAAALTAHGVTTAGKSATDRLRPDGSNRESFPSAHASGAAVYAALASRNVGLLPASDGWKTVARCGLAAADAGAAWARVEGGRHYPSDVLAGMALGHFLGTFFNDAFMGLGDGGEPGARLGVLLERGGFGLTFHLAL